MNNSICLIASGISIHGYTQTTDKQQTQHELVYGLMPRFLPKLCWIPVDQKKILEHARIAEKAVLLVTANLDGGCWILQPTNNEPRTTNNE